MMENEGRDGVLKQLDVWKKSCCDLEQLFTVGAHLIAVSPQIIDHNVLSSSSSLHGLGESPVPACSIVVSLSIVFLVYLCLVFRMVVIDMPVVECGYVPFFADVLSIYFCTLIFFA
jgi:hypothetical protein